MTLKLLILHQHLTDYNYFVLMVEYYFHLFFHPITNSIVLILHHLKGFLSIFFDLLLLFLIPLFLFLLTYFFHVRALFFMIFSMVMMICSYFPLVLNFIMPFLSLLFGLNQWQLCRLYHIKDELHGLIFHSLLPLFLLRYEVFNPV